MNIQIKSLHEELSDLFLDQVRIKAEKLYVLYEGTVGIDIVFKHESEFLEDSKVCEVTWKVRGNDLFSEKRGHRNENNFDMCCDALRKQIERYKSRL
jgi:putative sigma-54 modulation protein